MADCGPHLGTAEALRAAPTSLHHWLHLVGPSGWPCLLCLPPSSLLVLSLQPLLSSLCPEASKLSCANSVGLALESGRHALPCPGHPQSPQGHSEIASRPCGSHMQGAPHTCRYLTCTQKSPFRPCVFRLPSAPQFPDGETDAQDWGFGIDCLWLQHKAADVALGESWVGAPRGICVPHSSPRHRDALSEVLSGEQNLMALSAWLAALCQRSYQRCSG